MMIIQSVMHVHHADGDITTDLDQIHADAERLRNDVSSTANSTKGAQLLDLEPTLTEPSAKSAKKVLKALVETAAYFLRWPAR
jgi:hypothetical protein